MILTLFSFSIAVNILLALSFKAMRAQVNRYALDPTYGILTRAALEQRWSQLQRRTANLSIVFCDLDHMHQLNEQIGYQAVDRKIQSALKSVRHDEIAGRWYSGDELAILCASTEAHHAAARLLQAFQQQGLSATFGIAECRSTALLDNVKIAADLVQGAKRIGQRGTIQAC